MTCFLPARVHSMAIIVIVILESFTAVDMFKLKNPFLYWKVKKIITQNIDNLHQESGIPNDLVIELHGNTTYAKCLDCGKRYDLALIMKNFEKTSERDRHGI